MTGGVPGLADGLVRRGFVSGVTFQDRLVEYVEVDGLAICEGCIILGTVAELEARSREVEAALALGLRPKGSVVSRASLRWPGGLVPFEVDPALPDPGRVQAAMAHWEAMTAIRFVARTLTNAAQFPDYARFVPVEKGCNSAVGRQGGRQDVRLSPRCASRQVIHEIGHTIGLYHEQSRRDRDQCIRIHFENMASEHAFNFTQMLSDGVDLGPYDYASIMHYDALAFSINGLPTLESIPPGIAVGGATRLSAGDVETVRRLYAAGIG